MGKTLDGIINKIKAFRDERDWAQFHDPKNLAEAISVEAGELLENFLWLNKEQTLKLSDTKITNIKEEISDIFIFLLYLCDVLKIDLYSEVERKITLNAEKYAVEKSRGTSNKYKEL